MDKRGQITIFIIIGIVILFSVGFYLYLTTVKGVGIVAPEKVHPVQAFVQGCIDQIGEDGIRIIGNTGGFIKYPPEIERNKRAYLATGLEDVKIPYWFHDGQSKIPSMDFIESQLNTHIVENLQSCLGDFEIYKQQYDIKPQGPIEASTEATENAVSINVKYPLKVESKDKTESFELQDHTVLIPIRLKRAYDLAKEIYDGEQAQGYLENLVTDLIVLDPEIPDTDFDLSCAPKIWKTADVKEKLKRLVEANFQFIKLENTRITPFPSEYPYMKTHYLWTYSTLKFQDMRVAIKFNNDWPFTLVTRPSSGGLMRSNPLQGQEILSSLCTQIWHFTYDVKFPVMTSIVDDQSSTHDSYTFNYAMMVDVDHNLPNKQAKGTQFFQPELTATTDDYCDLLGQEITLNLWDNVTGSSDILDANITMICGRYICDLGQSDWVSGQTAGLQQRVPSCTNALLQADKEGYETGKIYASTEVPKVVNLYMTPIKELSRISVKKHRSNVPEIARDLATNEQAVIIVTPVNSTRESFAIFPIDAPQSLTFLAGDDFDYDVNVQLIRGDDIVGGYISKWHVPWNVLKDSREIELHVVEQFPLPSDDVERALFIDALDEYSKNISAPVLR